MKLRVVFEKDETGYYVAEVPALPGCLSQGKTLEEARTNIKEAIAGWLAVVNEKAKKRHGHGRTIEVAV
ncbi:MAG: type II toxin-antitoxin system HicB family antitoxin [Elusimicrobiota bacterium]